MHTEPGVAETQNLQIPQDLVNALGQHKPKTDYGIEALKPSFFGRLVEKLIGPKN